MSTPFMEPGAVDPSQVFTDPAQMAELQGGQPAQAPEQPEVEPDPPAEDAIDLEGAIAHAIEVGCQQAIAASGASAEEFMRFSQGVNFLASALDSLQPNPDPGDAQYASTLLTVAQKQEQARLQHEAQVHATERSAQTAASRPTPSGT